jgi:peroxiredoxin
MKTLDSHRSYIRLMFLFFVVLIGQGWIGASVTLAEDDVFQALQASRFPERLEAPDFSLPSVSETNTKLSDFKGKVVLLNFWATWCRYCQKERPALQALYDRYKDKEFVVLSISIDRTSFDIVKKYVEANQITFPTLHDQTMQTASEYGVRGVPTTYFIDREGKAVGGVIGPREWDGQAAQGLIEYLLSHAN